MAKRNAPRSEAGDAAAPEAPKTRRARGAPAPSRAATSEAMTSESNQADPLASESMASAAERAETAGYEPNEEEIRLRAYHRYLERGGTPGMDFDDWLEAERELRSLKSEV